MIERPIFLVGAHRSGTTLLRLMIDHHPQVSFRYESEYLTRYLTPTGEYPDLEQYRQSLKIDRGFQSNGLTWAPVASYPELVNHFLAQVQSADGKPLVGTTVHVNFAHLLKLWPQARFIFLYRDPRDVARSCIQMGWAGNLWFGVEGWLEAERMWQALKPQLQPEQALEIQYETLIREPETTLGQICRFIGVDYDPRMLSYPEDSTYEAPNPQLLNQWKKKLTPAEIQQVETRVGALLTERNYEPSGLPALTLTPAALNRLKRQSQWRRWQFRRRRYGLALTLLEALANKTQWRALQSWTQPRINRITQSYLK
jgi:hypothetical protein